MLGRSTVTLVASVPFLTTTLPRSPVLTDFGLELSVRKVMYGEEVIERSDEATDIEMSRSPLHEELSGGVHRP